MHLHHGKGVAQYASSTSTEADMNTLARYLELIVDPTWDDFHNNRDSVRHAFLACAAIYHAIDRVAEEEGKRAAHLRQLWFDGPAFAYDSSDCWVHSSGTSLRPRRHRSATAASNQSFFKSAWSMTMIWSWGDSSAAAFEIKRKS
jgi:hypothetical protein